MNSERFVRLAFRCSALAEALTWVGMITALVIKYPLQGSPFYVTVFGRIHGIVWILFVVTCIAAAIRFRWSRWVALVGLAVSVLPFLTVPFDLWMERSSRLSDRPATAAFVPKAAAA